jgi:thiamine-phosphate pyrophosphorylase
MSRQDEPQRCRIVLVVPEEFGPDDHARLEAALSGGDVASVILPQFDRPEADFQHLAEILTPIVQQAGAACILAGDSRIAMRVKADGIHVESGRRDLAEAVERHGGRLIVGAGGVKTRDEALGLGEAQPDYLFFGRFGYDTQAEPHPRNLTLARWWAEMIEIPCIVLGGSDIASVADVARSGAEFVALSQAVWACPDGPAEAVRRANAILDENAPSFMGDADAS